MKTLWAASLVMALVLAQPAWPQSGAGAPAGQHRAVAPAKTLTDYLGLTADQQAQIRPIMKDTAQQVRAARADKTLTPAQRKARVKDIRQAAREQILRLLTPTQEQKLAALRQRMP